MSRIRSTTPSDVAGESATIVRKPWHRLRSSLVVGLAVVGTLGATGVAQADDTPPAGADTCATGEFCAWSAENFQGSVYRQDLRTATLEECLPLPAGTATKSFANRTDRPITVYQSEECSDEADFRTYPGGGTYVPQAPYQGRAIKIWTK